MLLTVSKTPIFGWIVRGLGWIMDVVFNGLYAIGIPNIGLAIIIFTLIIYLLMTPLTIKQQKFSRLSSKMNPEIQEIQKKYKGKQDQESMARMNMETQNVYAKYGVNPMGSCLQLLIQMPVLFALYRVIWNIPAYVTKVKDVIDPLAAELLTANGAEEFLGQYARQANVDFAKLGFNQNTIIDILYKFKPGNWGELAGQFPQFQDNILNTQGQLDKMNTFGILNIADSPMNIVTTALATGAILALICAVLIPVLAAVTQFINTKLTMAATSNPNQKKGEDQMGQTMETMNKVMPLMSAVFCLSLPVGLGIYWIAGAVIRSIQAVFINRMIDKMDVDDMVKKNLEKINSKRAKDGLPPQKEYHAKNFDTRKIEVKQKSAEEKKASMEQSTAYYKTNSTAKPGSLAAKAQMVKQYNDKNDKKSK